MRALIINLDSATDRWAFIQESFARSQLVLCRVPAIDRTAIKLPDARYSEKLYRWFHGRTPNLRELACYLSHLKAIEAFLATDEEHALIGEDDLVLRPLRRIADVELGIERLGWSAVLSPQVVGDLVAGDLEEPRQKADLTRRSQAADRLQRPEKHLLGDVLGLTHGANPHGHVPINLREGELVESVPGPRVEGASPRDPPGDVVASAGKHAFVLFPGGVAGNAFFHVASGSQPGASWSQPSSSPYHGDSRSSGRRCMG